MRIWFVGSHGTGKTAQLEHFISLHSNLHRVDSSSDRRDLVERGVIKVNREAMPWDEIVIGGGVMREILATPAPSIGDRSWIDKCAYAQLLPYSEEVRGAMHIYYSAAWFGQKEDDFYFLFPTGVLPLKSDGIRDSDVKYQEDVNYWIHWYLEYFDVDYINLQAKSIQDRYLEIKEVLDYFGASY